MADGKTKAAAKHGVRKGFEASTLLGIGGALLVSNGWVDAAELAQGQQELADGHYIGAAFVALAVAVRYVPAVLRRFGWTRTATAFEDARAPDSPGGEDVTVGEIVDIGQAAYNDFDSLEERGKRGDMRGEGAE